MQQWRTMAQSAVLVVRSDEWSDSGEEFILKEKGQLPRSDSGGKNSTKIQEQRPEQEVLKQQGTFLRVSFKSLPAAGNISHMPFID